MWLFTPFGFFSVVADRDRLAELTAPIEMHGSQTGMLVAIGGRFTVLDAVSQPDVLDSLFAPLVQGYALDALDAPATAKAPSTDEAKAFLERILALAVTEHDGIGLGRELRATGPGLAGAGLVAADELVQLSVFAADTDTPGPAPRPGAARAARVLRPSRRSV